MDPAHPHPAAGASLRVADLDHNPHLRPWRQPSPNNIAGKGRIEAPGQALNLVWQNRTAPPTDYENALGDALEQVFEAGASELEQVVDGLNARGLRMPDGGRWSVEAFEREMARLGA